MFGGAAVAGVRRLVGIPGGQLRASVVLRHARSQPADDLHAGGVFAAAIGRTELPQLRQRRPRVGAAYLQTPEASGGDADDLERRTVDEHGPAEHVRVTIEMSIPPLVAQDDHRVAARTRVIGRHEGASQTGLTRTTWKKLPVTSVTAILRPSTMKNDRRARWHRRR